VQPRRSSEPPAPLPPTAAAHIKASSDHLQHGDRLRASGVNDPVTVGWAITALFYSALHAVRAYLKACKNIEISSHDDHKAKQRHEATELNRTAVDYRQLEQQSQSARYYCNGNFTWDDFDHLRKNANKVANTWIPRAEACLAGAVGKTADA